MENKPLDYNYDNERRVFDQLTVQGWSTTHGTERVEDNAQRAVQPLLVVSYPFALPDEYARAVGASFAEAVQGTGWVPIVVDCMSEGKVQAFGVDAPALGELSLDDIIELLEGLKRVKEAQGWHPGLRSKS
jgi:hypothetical protein